MKRNCQLLTLSVVAAGCLSLAGTSFGQTGITGSPRNRTNTGTNDTGITTTQDAQTNGTGPVTSYGEANQTTRTTNTDTDDVTNGRTTRSTRSSTKSRHHHKKQDQSSDESQSGSQNDNSQGGSSDNGGRH